ncbi:MAG: hypothetical protein GY951_16650 [Psychromonas sp.]|nr:hypothetical protein [Alteromonadales bacterium]MCP5079670.1 hypothetical protein [Psychromonas sp.]
MKKQLAITVASLLALSACSDDAQSNDSHASSQEHVYEKKQLIITESNAPIVASVIFDLEDFARAPLDMLNEPYNAPKIMIPNLARTEELAVSEKFKGDFAFDADNDAQISCNNGPLYNEQSTYSVTKEIHSIVDGGIDDSQQAVLSYWFVANHCDRLTGEVDKSGLAKITGAIRFTAQWVKGIDGQLVNFNGVVKTTNATSAPQGVKIPENYPDLFINYGDRNEVRFDEVNTNMMISGDQFELHYSNIKLYSEFNGRGGSLVVKTVSDAPIVLRDRYIKHEYVSGQAIIEADNNTEMHLTMDESAVTVTVTLENGETFTDSYSYSELYEYY